MNDSISETLLASLREQTTPGNIARIVTHLERNHDANPENSSLMREIVNGDDYADRGMWGPLGGKSGTVSQAWLREQEHLEAGGVSEFGLMITEPPQQD